MPLRYSVASATWQSETRGLGSLKISISRRARSETWRATLARRRSRWERISAVTGTLRPLMSICIVGSLRRLWHGRCYAWARRMSIAVDTMGHRRIPDHAWTLSPEVLLGATLH